MIKKVFILFLMLIAFTGCSNTCGEVDYNDGKTFIAEVKDDGSFIVVDESDIKAGDELVIVTVKDGNYIFNEYDSEDFFENVIKFFKSLLLLVLIVVIIVEAIILFRRTNKLKKLLKK